jgi:hypothetical protein
MAANLAVTVLTLENDEPLPENVLRSTYPAWHEIKQGQWFFGYVDRSTSRFVPVRVKRVHVDPSCCAQEARVDARLVHPMERAALRAAFGADWVETSLASAENISLPRTRTLSA